MKMNKTIVSVSEPHHDHYTITMNKINAVIIFIKLCVVTFYD